MERSRKTITVASPSPNSLPRERQYVSRRQIHGVLIFGFFFLVLYSLYLTTAPPLTASTVSIAQSITARELLERPLSNDWTTVPKIIHQAWFPAASNMSKDAQARARTLIAHNPGWEYVLWDDETNELLVQRYFPWFLETYRALPTEIDRADIVRYFYMYLFGGMYVDVNTEALLPVDPLFASHATTLAAHTHILSTEPRQLKNAVQRAFMGRVAQTEDVGAAATVSNSWMASPPGHPFWLMPVLHVLENRKDNDDDALVEEKTGSGILASLIKLYYRKYRQESLRQHLCGKIQTLQASWELFCHLDADVAAKYYQGELRDSLVLLPSEQISPYNWVDDDEGGIPACEGLVGNSQFDPVRCKELVGVDAWPSYFITYGTRT